MSFARKGMTYIMDKFTSLGLILFGLAIFVVLLQFEMTQRYATVFGGLTIGMGISGLFKTSKTPTL